MSRCCCGRCRRGRGSGWVADGAGCGVSSRVFTASVYEWVGRWDGRGNHGLGTRLSEMWGKLRKYPHRFEAVLSVQGYHGHFACLDFTRGGSFRARCNFRIARSGLTWRELLEHNETKIYLKYFRLTRRGLKRREFRSMIDKDASLNFRHNKARLEISEEQA